MKRGFELLKADLKTWWKGILIFLFLWAALSFWLGTPCFFVWGLGIPCPFCGMTRAGFKLLCGDFAGSFALQPMLIPVLCAIGLLALTRYVNRKLFPIAIVYCVICFCLCIGLYAWKMITVFPGEVPYVYTEKNIFRLLWELSH